PPNRALSAAFFLSSLMMGTWFLANAAANKFAGTLSALIPPSGAAEPGKVLEYPKFMGMEITNLYQFFMLFIIMTGVAAGILFLLSAWLQNMIREKHDEFKPELEHQ
ncbi:MAG TPA: hypothetical protein PLP34_02390, partial [Chitinophagaceae bacterium]|nr:hypothetical protein [Chitinophagaceae bacterium]